MRVRLTLSVFAFFFANPCFAQFQYRTVLPMNAASGVPGGPSGSTFDTLTSYAVDDLGNIAIAATARRADSNTFNGIWYGQAGLVNSLVLTGQSVPGYPGYTWGSFNSSM